MGARNKLTDVRDHAFEWLERLKDDDIQETDINKAKVSASLCKVIVDSSKVEVMYMQMLRKNYEKVIPISDFFELDDSKIRALDQQRD